VRSGARGDVAALRQLRRLTYTQLAATAERALADGFDGSVRWCVTVVSSTSNRAASCGVSENTVETLWRSRTSK
jgi:hypothetical protein